MCAVRTFKLESFYVDRHLYHQMEYMRKPKSNRARSKAKRKLSAILDEVIQKKQSYSFVTFSADVADDCYAIRLFSLKEFNPAFDTRLTIFCRSGSFHIIEKDTDPYWMTYINFNRGGEEIENMTPSCDEFQEDALYFNNSCHCYLRLTEL